MTDRRYGPHYIEVDAIPAGATINVRNLMRDLLHQIATEEGLLDDLYAYANALETGVRPDPHKPEPQRLDKLLDRLDTRAFLYGAEVGRAAQQLADIAKPKPLPQPRQGGAAA
jgi:hypothetical protein